MDALDTVLRSLRMNSSVLSRARYGAPWAVVTQGADFPILHAIVEGRCKLVRERETLDLEAGDVVVLPHGSPHVMTSDPSLQPTPVRHLSRQGGGVTRIDHGGPGERSVIICGTFHLDHEGGAWLVGLLPALVHMRPKDDVMRRWVDSTVRLLDAELASAASAASAVIARITDLLVLQALRHDTRSENEEQLRGWLAAVRDERVGKALALIHDDPAGDWSAGRLASTCGMSRTRFFERFSMLVGEPPARYLARWRANAAADLIRRRNISIAEAAEAVGYGSERALSGAFRRHLGVTPGAFRRRLRAADTNPW